eukprot:3241827-Prymnesium_polylepis.1
MRGGKTDGTDSAPCVCRAHAGPGACYLARTRLPPRLPHPQKYEETPELLLQPLGRLQSDPAREGMEPLISRYARPPT